MIPRVAYPISPTQIWIGDLGGGWGEGKRENSPAQKGRGKGRSRLLGSNSTKQPGHAHARRHARTHEQNGTKGLHGWTQPPTSNLLRAANLCLVSASNSHVAKSAPDKHLPMPTSASMAQACNGCTNTSEFLANVRKCGVSSLVMRPSQRSSQKWQRQNDMNESKRRAGATCVPKKQTE